MAQQRINIFGSLVDTADLPTMVASLFSPGRFLGCGFEVGGVDLLRISPGSALLPDGVLILEDEAKNIVIDNSSYAADYTLIYQLDDTTVLGGSPAALRKTSGITRQDDFADAVVLGWIRYPGGSVPLSSSHFIQPFPLRVSPKTATYYTSLLAPFAGAVRPAAEKKGSQAVQLLEFASVTATQTKTFSFGGQRVRVLGASVLSAATVKTITVAGSVVSDPANYVTIELKKGQEVLYRYDTRATPTGQDYLRPGVPGVMKAESALAPTSFIVEPSETLSVSITRTNSVPDSSGSVTVLYETPASSGLWAETSEVIANEFVTRWKNVAATPQVYTLSLPFVVPSQGQPRKLVTRLLVDFNCILTLSIRVSGTTIVLSPNKGIVSNTGALITREFDIPVDPTLTWTPASLASVEVEINAQPGRSAALGQVSLALEPSPFLLFTAVE